MLSGFWCPKHSCPPWSHTWSCTMCRSNCAHILSATVTAYPYLFVCRDMFDLKRDYSKEKDTVKAFHTISTDYTYIGLIQNSKQKKKSHIFIKRSFMSVLLKRYFTL